MNPLAKKITPAVIAVIRRADGKYLMTDRVELDPEDAGVVMGDDFWQIPGGGLEIGETVEAAVSREVKEETGLDIEIVAHIPKIYSCFRPGWHGLLLCYLCRPTPDDQNVVLNHESSRYEWMTAEKIVKAHSFPETADVITQAEKLV